MLKIDMNKFKSIWGLMLGILPPGVNRLGEAGLPHDGCLIQRPTKTRMVALQEDPRPKGGLRPVDINRHEYVTCIVS